MVFTAYDADEDVFRAIRGGARGYLLKGSPAAEIAQAIRQVHAGESYLSPRIAAKLVKGVVEPRSRTGLLSARERGVLRLVAAGLSNRQIGETLSITERTVKFHVTAIFNKLGAENRAQAVALAAERGPVEHYSFSPLPPPLLEPPIAASSIRRILILESLILES